MTQYNDILTRMKNTYQELSGFSPTDASDIGIRMQVLSYEIFSLLSSLETAKLQLFPQTATGEYLDMHAQTRGITRKGATYAGGNVVFSRTTAADHDILIPKDTLLSTPSNDPVRFVTTKDCVLPAGELSVAAGVVAQTAGTDGNVAAGMVTVMVTPVVGIATVKNTAAFSGGVLAEDDETLRSRLLEAFSKITNGTNSAFYYHTVMKYEGISSANVLPRERGAGTVDIVVASQSTQPSKELLSQIAADLNALKELNVDISVYSATQRSQNITIAIAPKDGYTFEEVASSCKENLHTLIARQKVGESFLLADIADTLFHTPGVYNYTISQPTADVHPLKTQIITAGTITVDRLAVSGV